MGRIIPIVKPAAPKKQLSDQALLVACSVGDTAAMHKVFEGHCQAVQRFVSRLASAGPSDVDDLVQETFVEVFRSASRFRGQSSVRTWIFAIAKNLVRRHIRKSSRRRRMLRHLEPIAASHLPEEAAYKRQLLSRLQNAIDHLPQKLKEVFVLVDLEKMKGAEAARLLAIKEGTLWRRLHDARKQLSCAVEDK